MATGVARRLLIALVTLVLVTLAVFALISSVPGTALDIDEGNRPLPPAQIEAIRAQFHLDESIPRRYTRWIRDLARGDLGVSLSEQRPVSAIVAERLPVSLALNAAALLVTLIVALPWGILGAWRPGGLWDRIGGLAGTALVAVPVFWMALLLQWLFAVRLGWLPLFGTSTDVGGGWLARVADGVRHGVLPVVCLSYASAGYVSRFVRTTLVEGTGINAGRGARARGLSALRYVASHGLAQAAVPILTLLGFLIPRLVGGSILVEQIFGIPGLGQLMLSSILARDLPVVLALTLVAGVATLVGATGADLLATRVDPRMRRDA